jgi:hypothetical protein
MSNHDILEVLGQSKRPENVQRHLKKCFHNVNKIKMVKVGRMSPYSIYWRQSLNINKAIKRYDTKLFILQCH